MNLKANEDGLVWDADIAGNNNVVCVTTPEYANLFAVAPELLSCLIAMTSKQILPGDVRARAVIARAIRYTIQGFGKSVPSESDGQ